MSDPVATKSFGGNALDEKVAPVVEEAPTEFEDSKHRIDDEAGALANRALASGDLDTVESRKVLRKIDLYILPLLFVTYDKTTLGYSSVFGIIKDNHLHGQQYSWSSSIFYFGYMLAEYPGVALLQRFPLAKFLGVNIIAWAIILMISAACESFAGLATVRFFLGIFEATISPGFVAITGIWWTRQEQASRSAFWISALGCFGCIGGLITYAIGHIIGSLSPWKFIYLILGAITVVWGILFILVVPDSIATAKWLTEDEKVVAVQRVADNRMGTKTRTFVKAQVLEALIDPKILLLALISFVNAISSGGLSFGSLIIDGFGFDSLQTTLMGIPFSALQALSTLFAGWVQSQFPNARLIISSLAMIPPIIGTCLINQLDTSDKWGRLVGYWLLASYPAGFMVLLGLLSANIAGTTKRSTASAMVFVMYCVGQIVGPQCFRSNEAPSYHSGISAMLVGYILNLVFNLILRILYVKENKKREQGLVGLSEAEVLALQEESRLQGFEDVTDKSNVFFRYVL